MKKVVDKQGTSDYNNLCWRAEVSELADEQD